MKAMQSLSKRLNGFALTQTCASIAAAAGLVYWAIPQAQEMAEGASAQYNACTLNRSLAHYRAAGGQMPRLSSCRDVLDKLACTDPVAPGAILTGPWIEMRALPEFTHDGWRVTWNQRGYFEAAFQPGQLGVARF